LPRISFFYGIAIYMYYREHQPPHFHAIYGDDEVVIAIQTLSLMGGRIPSRALGLVMEWASLHQADLTRAWQQAQAAEPITEIDPLR